MIDSCPNTSAALDQLRRLNPDDLRRRLAQLDAEQRALRVLLRSALARQRAADQQQEVTRDN
jgi:hypothetical protein